MNTTDAAAPANVHDAELHWLKNVYQPDARQLTVRAVIAGMLIGAVMCLSNLYIVLKTGWSLGVTITACVLAFAIFDLFRRLRLTKSEFSPLENNAMGSVASAAGYMTGGGNMAAVPALVMLSGIRPEPVPLAIWFAVISALGVFAAIPIKRQLINIEQIPFPSGTATAETIKALHSHKGEASQRASRLGLAFIVGALVAFFREAKWKWVPFNTPSHLKVPVEYFGHSLDKWSLSMDLSTLMIGVGMIVSWRTAWSMLLGGLLAYGVLGPWMVAEGAIATVSYKAIVQWTLWSGAGILVSSGLLSFAFQWKMIARSFKELAAIFQRKKSDVVDPMAEVEAPAWWFPAGFAVLGPVVVYLAWRYFDIPIWAGIVALPLAVLMGVVAARVTGETDFTPTKALGPLTQMTYGALLPGKLTANIMSANITGGVGLHAADLLTDLKSGYLLGARPRQQVYAQMFGVVAGAAAVVPAFNLLVPEASVLGSEALPAPGAQVWAGVSKVMVDGLTALHPTARIGALIGVGVGIVLALLERYAPKHLLKWVPSPSGIGVALVIPGYNSVSVFIGGLIAYFLRRRNAATAEGVLLPVSAGLIAGESLMGIAVIMLTVFKVFG